MVNNNTFLDQGNEAIEALANSNTSNGTATAETATAETATAETAKPKRQKDVKKSLLPKPNYFTNIDEAKAAFTEFEKKVKELPANERGTSNFYLYVVSESYDVENEGKTEKVVEQWYCIAKQSIEAIYLVASQNGYSAENVFGSGPGKKLDAKGLLSKVQLLDDEAKKEFFALFQQAGMLESLSNDQEQELQEQPKQETAKGKGKGKK